MKLFLSIDGVITKKDRSPFQEKESKNLIEAILEIIHKSGCNFAGGMELHTVKQYEFLLKEENVNLLSAEAKQEIKKHK